MSRAFAVAVEGLDMSGPEVMEAARDFSRLRCKPSTRTKQADKDACDINRIVRRNLESGILPQSTRVPMYGDISEIGSLQEALALVQKAGEDFAALTARQREAFGNDPMRFVQAADNPANAGLFRELGLIPAKEAPPEPGEAPNTVPT